ncbi:hypothetical protein QWZ06_07650 [Chryseobacterium tructae]|uniref:Bacteriocin n=1 Tax=Chryseobacterium tructae TaxID=1037380 RepID=A0ABV7XUB1_9FLAO|nr:MULTISPECIES: hypothetical protein [Chryseobacterium]MDN3692143.1 hypothetical protein [Chryseobacterium tructae]
MKKEMKKIDLSKMKVINKNQMAKAHGGLQQMEESFDITMCSWDHDIDKKGEQTLCSLVADFDN